MKQLTQIHYPENPEMDVYYEYGDNSTGNQAGRITRMQDASGVQQFFYGKLGEIIRNERTFVLPGGNETYTFAMEWEYDSWNRIKQMTYPDGEVVTYDYDTGGQLFAMQGIKGQDPYPIIDSIFYDKFGSRSYIAYGNGTSTQYDYEPYRRRLAGLQTMTGQNALMDLSYSYDNENNITGISNTAGAVNGLGGNYSYLYQYDDMYRLTYSIGSFTDNQQTIFPCTLNMSYSLSGNITGKTVDAMTLQAGAGQVHIDYEATYSYNPGRPHAIDNISGTNADHDFLWDENGNMTRHTNNTAGITRILCWDEENRLATVRDENNMSAYIYDAGGERVWKLTGQVQKMHVDGTGWVDIVDLNNKTLYVSPYLVFNEQGYSKHYYAGAERVSSRIGGGMSNALVDPITYTVDHLSNHDNYAGIASGLYSMLSRNIECTDMQMEYVTIEQQLATIQDSRNHNNFEDNRYTYHSDHLGSSSFLTDTSGTPTQHLQYLPFGEPFIEQRSVTDYYTPYTFSAKERDLETGYSYFGARYYDANISVWLSVDPMADKYPSMSAYMYCAGNPVMLVDPEGTFIVGSDNKAISYSRDDSGNILWSKNTTKDVQIIGELLLSSKIGTQLFEAALTAKYPISIIISDELMPENFGVCSQTVSLGKDGITPNLKRADIVIFEGTINQAWNDLMVSGCEPADIDGLLFINSFENTGNYLDVIGAVAVHELVHATDPKNIRENILNHTQGTNYPIEDLPNRMNQDFLIEKIPMVKCETRKITTIPTLEWLQSN